MGFVGHPFVGLALPAMHGRSSSPCIAGNARTSRRQESNNPGIAGNATPSRGKGDTPHPNALIAIQQLDRIAMEERVLPICPTE